MRCVLRTGVRDGAPGHSWLDHMKVIQALVGKGQAWNPSISSPSPNLYLTLPEASCPVHLLNATEAQHAAHDSTILLVPAIVTHRAPATLMEHLHSALVWPRAIHQANHCEIHTICQESHHDYLSLDTPGPHPGLVGDPVSIQGRES